MSTYSAEDGIVHVIAHAAQAVAQARRIAVSDQMSDAERVPELHLRLEHVLNILAEHVGALGLEPVTTYGDGTPVTSHVVLDEAAGDVFSMIWHPDPCHLVNQPRVAHESVVLSSGERRQLIVTARGVIDSVPVDSDV